jgi:predicted N-acetyltransferase YhbS
MKLLRWTRFTWDLSKLPPLDRTLPEYYYIRTAHRDDEKSVSNVIFSAFSLDSAWSDALQIFRERLQMQIEQIFERAHLSGVVISHGQRIIAASVLTTEPSADNHLLSGPCVLMEYRNRGLGTALLYHSLKQLQAAGLERVHGVTKENVVPSKFVYPRFGSISTPYDFEPALAGI